MNRTRSFYDRTVLPRLQEMMIAEMLAAPRAPAQELDGTTWKVHYQSTRTLLPFWNPATIDFEHGLFIAREFILRGYKPAPYVVKETESALAWSATLSEPGGGQMHWEAVLASSRMTGTFSWIKPARKAATYRWTAQGRKFDE